MKASLYLLACSVSLRHLFLVARVFHLVSGEVRLIKAQVLVLALFVFALMVLRACTPTWAISNLLLLLWSLLLSLAVLNL